MAEHTGKKVMMQRVGKDKIVLSGLEFHGYHGVFTEEQRFGARFVVDVEMGLELPPDDDLDKSIDYGAVYDLVATEVTDERHQLIETLAQRIAAALLAAHDRLDEVLVRVHKPHAPLPGIFRDVYVEVVRRRA